MAVAWCLKCQINPPSKKKNFEEKISRVQRARHLPAGLTLSYFIGNLLELEGNFNFGKINFTIGHNPCVLNYWLDLFFMKKNTSFLHLA